MIEVQDSESRDESHKTEPASKHINRKTKATELWRSFEEILEESGSLVDSGPTSVASSVVQYLAEALIEAIVMIGGETARPDFHSLPN